jgi:hypothetical protein
MGKYRKVRRRLPGPITIIAIVLISMMGLYVLFGVFGIFNATGETVCQNNRGILKRFYQLYAISDKKTVKDNTVGVLFLVESGYMTVQQAQRNSLSDMVWRVYSNGAVDVFCTDTEATLSTYSYESTFYAKDNVKALKGSWKVGNGVLQPAANGENRAAFGGTDGTDYTIEINATYISGSAAKSGYGIYYRATEKSDISGYVFQFDVGAGNVFVVRKVQNGKESSIIHKATMMETMGIEFDINKPHEIEIEITGSSHKISVDDVVVLTFEDDTFSGGVVGVRSWNDTQVSFNKVLVNKH